MSPTEMKAKLQLASQLIHEVAEFTSWELLTEHTDNFSSSYIADMLDDVDTDELYQDVQSKLNT